MAHVCKALVFNPVLGQFRAIILCSTWAEGKVIVWPGAGPENICYVGHQSLSLLQLQPQLWFSQTLVNHVVLLFSDVLINCTSFSRLALNVVINVDMYSRNFMRNGHSCLLKIYKLLQNVYSSEMYR